MPQNRYVKHLTVYLRPTGEAPMPVIKLIRETPSDDPLFYERVNQGLGTVLNHHDRGAWDKFKAYRATHTAAETFGMAFCMLSDIYPGYYFGFIRRDAEWDVCGWLPNNQEQGAG